MLTWLMHNKGFIGRERWQMYQNLPIKSVTITIKTCRLFSPITCITKVYLITGFFIVNENVNNQCSVHGVFLESGMLKVCKAKYIYILRWYPTPDPNIFLSFNFLDFFVCETLWYYLTNIKKEKDFNQGILHTSILNPPLNRRYSRRWQEC